MKEVCSEHVVISQIGCKSKIWKEMECTPSSRSRGIYMSSFSVAELQELSFFNEIEMCSLKLNFNYIFIVVRINMF
jgi:hypothetical protein